MTENREFVIQTRLGPEEKKTYYVFPKNTMIWPQSSGRGKLTKDLQARKLEGRKVKGFQGWVAEGNAHLYLDGKHWQLSPGFHFNAPVKSAVKRTVKS